MTEEEIIYLAEAAGFVCGDKVFDEVLLCFADLVAAAAREACAQVCDDIDTEYEGEDVLATWCAAAIRARGQA